MGTTSIVNMCIFGALPEDRDRADNMTRVKNPYCPRMPGCCAGSGQQSEQNTVAEYNAIQKAHAEHMLEIGKGCTGFRMLKPVRIYCAKPGVLDQGLQSLLQPMISEFPAVEGIPKA